MHIYYYYTYIYWRAWAERQNISNWNENLVQSKVRNIYLIIWRCIIILKAFYIYFLPYHHRFSISWWMARRIWFVSPSKATSLRRGEDTVHTLFVCSLPGGSCWKGGTAVGHSMEGSCVPACKALCNPQGCLCSQAGLSLSTASIPDKLSLFLMQ